jgi:hypothetical protein
MTIPTKECDAFMIDTYRSSADRGFHAGAITLKKRRTVEVLKWNKKFSTEDDANAYVREQLSKHNIPEMRPEGVLVH